MKKDFLNYLKSVQRSDGTISGYDSDLNIFFVWVLWTSHARFYVASWTKLRWYC